jgi:alkylation response protein AidB-like acyl-CoA dehydrogenase
MNGSTVDLDDFRQQVRAFFDAAVTDEFKETSRKSTSIFTPFEPVMKWQKILYDKGWLVPSWPEEYGGTGWSAGQQTVYAQEYKRAQAPSLLPHAVSMLGPCLYHLGTDEQKKQRLPGMLSGEHFYAQGYSEPGAGSDLAALKTRAVSDGDDYIINGSKIWSSYAHKANRMFMLVRTSTEGKKQAGISFLLVDDMSAPGIIVRPIVGLDGAEEQCEVFFENARVPKKNLIGKENEGWFVAKFLLQFERGAIGDSSGDDLFGVLKQMAEQTSSPHGGMIIDDPAFQVKLGKMHVKAQSLSLLGRKVSTATSEVAGRTASVLKIIGGELMQQITETRLELAGLDALPHQSEAIQVGSTAEEIGPEWALTTMPLYLNTRATTIYGGSNEIQKDIIAKTILQLPA